MRTNISLIAIGIFALIGMGVSTPLANAQNGVSTPSSLLLAQAFQVPPTPEPDSDAQAPAGAEALTQGPVHEAFAKPLELNPQPGHVVKKHPPNPVQEIPPDQQPDGD